MPMLRNDSELSRSFMDIKDQFDRKSETITINSSVVQDAASMLLEHSYLDICNNTAQWNLKCGEESLINKMCWFRLDVLPVQVEKDKMGLLGRWQSVLTSAHKPGMKLAVALVRKKGETSIYIGACRDGERNISAEQLSQSISKFMDGAQLQRMGMNNSWPYPVDINQFEFGGISTGIPSLKGEESGKYLQTLDTLVSGITLDNMPKDYAIIIRALTAHLLDCIKLEVDDKPDAYELRVSHPVICDQDNLFHLEETIGDALAGRRMQMQRIDFMDEAECAFHFALSNKNVSSKIYQALKGRQEAVALMCDIGGSTMELSLYRFKRQDRQVSYERMGMLRADDAAGRGMGSRTMDKTLHNKLNGMGLLDQEKLSQIPAELLQLKYLAPLKEDLNNRLRANKEGRLDKLAPIAVPAKLMENGRATKEQFEDWCAGYAASVCKQIKKLAEQEGTKAEEISLAILTGGGAELYPVEQAIRKLLSVHPHVLRPDDPQGVLDCPVDADNPDYIDGLCPKGEIASLACVLGNLAEDVKLEMPAEAPVEPQKPAFTPPKTQPVKPAVKENKYERRRYYCPDKGFVAFFKWCDNKYYCECDSVCTEYTCDCVSTGNHGPERYGQGYTLLPAQQAQLRGNYGYAAAKLQRRCGSHPGERRRLPYAVDPKWYN